MKDYNFQNIRRGKKTTIIGFILVISGVLSHFITGATWLNVTPVIAIGVGLLPMKQ